ALTRALRNPAIDHGRVFWSAAFPRKGNLVSERSLNTHAQSMTAAFPIKTDRRFPSVASAYFTHRFNKVLDQQTRR
ncbi:MAG: hypothetical protein KJN98_04235, partial [Pontiella sp.]|nr:hypothetical protein [Pontiella sp.]